MRLDRKTNTQFKILLDKLIDNYITPAEFKKLRKIIKNYSEARRYYIKYVKLHILLERYFKEKLEIENNRGKIFYLKHNIKKIALIAASFLIIFGLFYFIKNWDSAPYELTKSSTEKIVKTTTKGDRIKARITDMRNVRWKTKKLDLKVGSYLDEKSLQILDGGIALELNSGTHVILEGPADFEVNEDNIATLYKGKLTAYIPKRASGFILKTPIMTIKDIGTRFGVNIKNKLNSDIIVKEGKINLSFNHKGKYISTNINRGNAVIVNKKSIYPIRKTKYDEGKYAFNLEKKPVTKKSGYLHWKFDYIKDGIFIDSGSGINNQNYDARLINGNAGKNHIFKGKFGDSLKYTDNKTHIATDFKGIMGTNPRSILFWLKSDGQHAPVNVISWGDGKKGQSWDIRLSFTGRLAVRVNGIDGRGALEGKTGVNDNQWHHIAVIFIGGENPDVDTHINMYIDGKPETISRLTQRRINTQGTKNMTIGKIDKTKNEKHSPYFAVDELYIFDTALTSSQIESIQKFNELK